MSSRPTRGSNNHGCPWSGQSRDVSTRHDITAETEGGGKDSRPPCRLGRHGVRTITGALGPASHKTCRLGTTPRPRPRVGARTLDPQVVSAPSLPEPTRPPSLPTPTLRLGAIDQLEPTRPSTRRPAGTHTGLHTARAGVRTLEPHVVSALMPWMYSFARVAAAQRGTGATCGTGRDSIRAQRFSPRATRAVRSGHYLCAAGKTPGVAPAPTSTRSSSSFIASSAAPPTMRLIRSCGVALPSS